MTAAVTTGATDERTREASNNETFSSTRTEQPAMLDTAGLDRLVMS